MGQIWRPKRDASVLVAEMDNGVVSVLSHGIAGTEFGPMFDEELPCRRILVF